MRLSRDLLLFTVATGVLTAGITAGLFILEELSPIMLKTDPVGLTRKETNLVKGIFGAEIETAGVGKHFEPPNFLRPLAGKVFDARTVAFFGARHHSPDYSLEEDVFKYGLFVHELTHVWQYQTGVPMKGGCDPDYTRAAQTRFDSYCYEQQASLVEDYARRFLRPAPAPSYYQTDTLETDKALKETVEDRFPGARGLRLAVEAEKTGRRDHAPRGPAP